MTLLDTAASPTPLASRPRASDQRSEAEATAWSRQAACLTVAGLCGFAIVAYSIWLITGTVIPWDSKNHFYPMFRFLADALQHGEIPFWNPYHFAGHPTIADPQSLLFTPTMVVFALLAPQASMQLFDGVIFAHLLFGGLGILCICRARGWHPAAALLSAMIFMLGGAAASRLQHTGMIISYAFFPWALWSLDRAIDRISLKYAALFGVFACLMTLGRDQVAFLLALILIGRLAWRIMTSGQMFAYLRERIGVIAVMGTVVVLGIGIPTLLTMQFLGGSNRPGISYGVAAAGSLAPVNLITLFAPNIFGSLDWAYDYWGPGYETMPDPDWTDRCINYLFIGTLPILLLVWHGLAGGRLFARGSRFFAIVLLAALTYAVGRETPVFSWAFDWLPGVSLYRRPADATFAVNIMLALMSGYLLHRYIQDGLPSLPRFQSRWLAFVLPVATGTLVAALFGLALNFAREQHHLLASLLELSIGSGLLVLASAILILLRSRRRRALAATLLVLVTGAELVCRDAGASFNAEKLSRYGVYAQLPPGDARGIALLQQDIADKVKTGEHPRVEILGLSGPWQNASMVLKLENTVGYNPLRISDYERAVGPGENAEDPFQRHFPGTFRGYKCALASLLGLEYLVLGEPLTKLPRHFPRPSHIQQFYIGDSMYIYKIGQAAQRTYVATKIKPVDSSAVIDDATMPDFDRSREVLIDEADLSNLSSQLLDANAELADTAASITRYDDNAVTIDVTTSKPGIVVLHDLYYPGWQVMVDGNPKPLLKANIIFRGVEVPAGHHVVTFAFRPLAFANLGAALSGLLHKVKNDD
jgi:hypothetical protein